MVTSEVRLAGTPRPTRRIGWRVAMAAMTAGALLLAAGCSGEKSPTWQGGGEAGKDGKAAPASAAPKLKSVAVTSPKAGATNVQALSAVKFKSDDPASTTVTVKDAAGNEVDGKVDTDAGTWTPSKALSWGKKYQVTVNGKATEDKIGTTESSFTVMKKPAETVDVTSLLGDDWTVGVGMPLMVKFGVDVPEKYRAGVERHMNVQTTPEQEGTWHWTSPSEIHYRPKTYWKANTKISYSANMNGVPMGGQWYGGSTLNVNLKVGRSLIMTVDNKNKMMTVTRDGKTVKKIPVSLGKSSTPSSSGTMIVMEKKRKTVFDTFKELGKKEGYRVNIDYAQRLTWGGEFIHAAPWSEGAQGNTNTSHGCVNVSMANGAWLFDATLMGDPVTVKGTETRLENGNGWTDWNMSWNDYKQGSAL